MNNFHNKYTGNIGEEEVCKYLTKNNYKIIQRNFSCRSGEIDIIAIDINKNEYVFIEVKTRLSKKCGRPAEAVDSNKRKHIINATRYYIYINKLENKNIRFDVVEVYIYKKTINHIKNAFYTLSKF